MRGQIRLDGRSLDGWRPAERARRIAWLDQQGEAGGELTARDIVALGRLPHLGLFGAPSEADADAVRCAMALTECEGWSPAEACRLATSDAVSRLGLSGAAFIGALGGVSLTLALARGTAHTAVSYTHLTLPTICSV